MHLKILSENIILAFPNRCDNNHIKLSIDRILTILILLDKVGRMNIFYKKFNKTLKDSTFQTSNTTNLPATKNHKHIAIN